MTHARAGEATPRASSRARLARCGLVTVVLMLAMTLSGCASTPVAARVKTEPDRPCPWVGSKAPVTARVRAVLARMTQAEKLSMVHGLDPGVTDGYAGTIVGVARLCIPPLHLADGPGGVGDLMGGVTQLPAPVALAATWDPALAHSYGAVIGSEARGKGVGVVLGPTVNIVRDPRWGRAFESLGEDPYLTSQLAVADIRGIQSAGPIAQVKHFAAYNQETNRDTAADNVIVDERTLREIYLRAFEAAVRVGHTGSVMCAYSTVNGAPACANQRLLNDVLKRDWGFDGFVTSDWYANLPGAVAAATGLDMQMPDNCLFGPALTDALSTGRVATTRLDDMVGRILGAMFSAGLVDRPLTGTPKTVVTAPRHVDVARTVAATGSVLLRNEHLLPIDAGAVHSIAVIGSGGTNPMSVGGGSATVVASSTVSPVEGITERAGPRTRVVTDDGTVPARAATVAASADLAVVFAGRFDSEFHDHTTLDLPLGDNALIRDVAAANHRTVVVLTTGSAVVMPWLDQVGAVLETWYPGQDGGHAIAALLFGDANPSGKLPVTFPASLGDVPAATATQWPGTDAVRYSEGLLVGYRSYDARGVTPLFPFGFGLSYTNFAFDHLRIGEPTDDGRVNVSVNVSNIGSRAGADVVQLYLDQPASTGEPARQLRAFKRVTLEPGERERVELTLDARALSHWDSSTRRWIAPKGAYRVLLGDSSAHLPARGAFVLREALASASAGPPSPAVATSPAQDAADLKRCSLDAAVPKANGIVSTPVTP